MVSMSFSILISIRYPVFKMLKNLSAFSGSLLFAGGDLLDQLYLGFIEAADLLIDELKRAVDLAVHHHGAA